MNQITDPANPNYDFGYDFNYAQWTQGTELTLTNVPWDNNYRDIVKFDDASGLDKFIDSRLTSNTTISNASYAKVNEPIKINTPFNEAYRYNYIRARNPLQPVPGAQDVRTFYYFITNVVYSAPNTTVLTVQLDIWQTFGSLAEFGNCYIERGHIGIANENQMQNYGRDHLTMPEGLDTGAEYQHITSSDYPIMGASLYHVLIASTVDLEADPGTVNDPTLISAPGGYLNNLPSGASYYVFNSSGSLQSYLNSVKDKPWVTQGIISITLVPPITRYFPSFTFGAHGTPTKAPTGVPARQTHKTMLDWRNQNQILEGIPLKYRHLRKFLTYPYMVIELTTFTGTPIILKPESWKNDDAEVMERISMVPPNQRVAFIPRRYNGSDTNKGFENADDGGDYLDIATLIANFPTMAIVNNNASMYLASNANSIAFANRSADWSQQRAMRGNQTSYDQASSAMGLAENMGVNSRNADIAQTNLQNKSIGQSAILSSITGVVGGAGSGLVGGPAGAAIGGVSGMGGAIAGNISAMMQQGVNSDSLAIRNSSNLAATNMGVNQAGYIRDTNKSLADWAARGDYENTIAGINAKIQDSQLTPPSTSGQVGGDTMNIIHNDAVLSVRWKIVDKAHIRAIGDYWLRYGYAVQQFARIPASLKVMTKFTYWKLSETYLTVGPMPESMKQGLRGLFEKGVTVWSNPDDIGNVDIADNKPLEGITL